MIWWALRHKIHTSWLIMLACLGIFVGVLLASTVKIDPGLINAGLILSFIFIFVPLLSEYVYLAPLILLGGVLFGLWRGSISQAELAQFRPLYGKMITVSGSVKDDVDIGTSNQIVIRLDGLTIDDKAMAGTLWVTSNNADIKRGDQLIISGKLTSGFGNFAGIIYRANIDKIIRPQPGDIARVVRDWFADAIRRVIPDPESSLGIGFLVGQRRSLPTDLVLALQLAGLTHVVVASGYNLTILVRLARRLFVKVSKYLSVLSAGVMIVAFVAITGASPSMTRAALVSGLSLAAWYYGRKFHPIVLLMIAVAVTVIINPGYAWGDLGWQLSFAAFAGVMILAPLATKYLFGDKQPGFIGQILIETVSAQIATAPIIIAAFGMLSNVAVVSNLLVLPLVPLAMLLTFIAGLGSLILPAIGGIISLPATWLLHYMVSVTEYLASLPWVSTKVEFTWWMVAIYYIILVSICVYMWRVTKCKLRDSNLVE
ncbi:ComEC/Rec2 family competence protein [Candidatus Saccharibacteria bacterium]|nr:ComEC/Rec2 family competence protein [Candidatus Saccharibacteria bacterium]